MAAKTNDPYVTKSMLDESLDGRFADFEKRVDAKIDRAVDELTGVIRDFSERVDERFNRLEKRVDRLEEKMEHLTETLDNFLKRLDDIEKDNAARDAHIARLERKIEAIARQTGIKLDY